MKKIILLILTASLILAAAGAEGIRDISAAQGARTGGGMLNFSDITGKEWYLIEVHIDGLNTQFRRSSLPREFNNLFTINFDGNTAYGAGVPNRYSAPYSTGENQTISIMLLRTTMMASLIRSDNLKEQDFFFYLQNSHSWNIIGGQFELHSKTSDGRGVRMVFNL